MQDSKDEKPVALNPYRQFFMDEYEIMKSQLEDGDNLLIEGFVPGILHIMDLAREASGGTGASQPYYAGALSHAIKKALLFEPLSPLTGEDSEWSTVDDFDPYPSPYIFNKRDSRVYKLNGEARPVFSAAIHWQRFDDHNDTFGGTVEGITTRQYVKSFPFTPKTFYIDVYREAYDPKGRHSHIPESESVGGSDTWVYFIKDKSQLDEVWEYYDRYEPNQKQL